MNRKSGLNFFNLKQMNNDDNENEIIEMILGSLFFEFDANNQYLFTSMVSIFSEQQNFHLYPGKIFPFG